MATPIAQAMMAIRLLCRQFSKLYCRRLDGRKAVALDCPAQRAKYRTIGVGVAIGIGIDLACGKMEQALITSIPIATPTPIVQIFTLADIPPCPAPSTAGWLEEGLTRLPSPQAPDRKAAHLPATASLLEIEEDSPRSRPAYRRK